MIVSTHGRYALRVMLDLADSPEEFVPLKDIAQRQEISKKYLESITAILVKAGLVDSLHGKSGGYRLNRPPQEYTVGNVLTLTEGSLTPVNCRGCSEVGCERAGECRTMPLWKKLDSVVADYLGSVTLADLMNGTV